MRACYLYQEENLLYCRPDKTNCANAKLERQAATLASSLMNGKDSGGYINTRFDIFSVDIERIAYIGS